jgi:hypothetical protein
MKLCIITVHSPVQRRFLFAISTNFLVFCFINPQDLDCSKPTREPDPPAGRVTHGLGLGQDFF